MAIKIVAKLSKKEKVCYGCGVSTHDANYYEGDTETSWCIDCYVTDEQLKETMSKMPFCQVEKPKPKIKIRIVTNLKPKAEKTKKVKCTVVPFLSVPFD